MPLPPNATDFAEDFAARVGNVYSVHFVSTDGVETSHSATLDRERSEYLAAAAAGHYTLATKASTLWDPDAEPCEPALAHRIPGHGWMLLRYAGENTVLAVLTGPNLDFGVISYEMDALIYKVRTTTSTPARGAMP